MKYLVAIDPGSSTGIAVFIGDTLQSVNTTQAPHDELRVLLRDLKFRHAHDVVVVCEQGPVNRLQADTCAAVEQIVEQEANTIEWVRASQWKGTPTGTTEHSDVVTNRHERDAVCIGRWFLRRKALV